MSFYYISDVKQLSTYLVDGVGQKLRPLSLTIGNFDGLHLGHQLLINESLLWSQKNNGQSLILTFEPHPALVLDPQLQRSRLFSLQDQREQLQRLGVDGVVVQNFNEKFAQISAADFLNDYIYKYFHPQQIVVGYDFGFGRGREGNLNTLKEFCENKKIDLKIIPALKIDHETVSTSRIRDFLQQGEVEKANIFLGRSFYIQGQVIQGDQRGRTLDFATANLKLDSEFTPRTGVYVTRANCQNRIFQSVTNIGLNPTVSNSQTLKVESHFLDFNENIYGQIVKLQLLHFLRSEKKFNSLAELKAQISLDVENTRKWFL